MMRAHDSPVRIVLLLLLLLVLVAPRSARASAWPEFGRDLANSNASDETWLTPANANLLVQEWASQGDEALVAGPIAVRDTLYCGTLGGQVHALSLLDGSPIWTTQLSGAIYGSILSRGNRLYVGDLTCTAYCLEQSTGQVVWSTQVGDPSFEGFFGGGTLALNRLVFGVSTFTGDNPCSRGRIVALEAATGNVMWTWEAVDSSSTGGGVWNTTAVELAGNRLFVATANPCTGNPGEYTNAIVCLDTFTGAEVWHYQAIPNDIDDMGFGGSPVLFNASGIRGVAAGNKDGQLWAVDRETGQFLWSTPLAGRAGFAGDIGVISTPAVWAGLLIVGTGIVDANHAGSVTAVDAATGGIVWRRYTSSAVYGPVAVINGVVLSTDGLSPYLLALNAATGDSLALIPMGAALGAVFGGPTVSHGKILVSNLDWRVYAFTIPGITAALEPEEGEGGFLPRAALLTAQSDRGVVRFHARGDNLDGSRVDIFDAGGRITASVWLSGAGPHEATGAWDMRGRGRARVPAGVYLARSSGGAATRFMAMDR